MAQVIFKEIHAFFSSNRILILLFWGICVLKGVLYISITPVFEGFDEPWHYSYIQEIAEHFRFPHAQKSKISMEINESFSYLPHPPFSEKGYTFYDYWKLSREDRIQLRNSLLNIPRDFRKLDSEGERGQYQAQHPPLYYLICVPIYSLMSDYDLIYRVFSLRLLSVILSSLTIPFGYLAIRKWFHSDQVIQVIVTGIIISMPLFYFDTSRIGNDSLGVPLFTVMLLLCGVIWNGNWSYLLTAGLAIILGLGLLTKAYFTAAIPPIIALFLLKNLYDHTSLKIFLNHLVILFIGSLMISSWWYIRNYMNYGTFTGLYESIINHSDNSQSWYLAIFDINPGRFFRRVIDSHLWPGHWSFVKIPKYFSRTYRLIFFLGIFLYTIKILHAIVKKRVNKENFTNILIWLFYTIFWIAMYYHTLQAWNLMGHIMTGGWYLCAVIVFEVVILVKGYSFFFRKASLQLLTYLTIFFFFIITETYGIFLRLLPFYSGIAYKSEEKRFIFETNSLGLYDYVDTIIHRLTWNQPDWVTKEFLLSLFLLILISYAAVIVVFIKSLLKNTVK
jgi:hypothetical protein